MTRAHIALAPLDEQRTGELAAAILRLRRMSDEFASYLCERSSGLPFAIEELLALLQARGTLVRRGGGWARRTLEELHGIDVPRGIRDQVGERLSGLRDRVRAVAEAAAVLQAPVPAAAVVGTCRLPAPQAARGVDEAIEAGLFAVHDGPVGFRHLLAAQAVYDDAPAPRRRDLHPRSATHPGTTGCHMAAANGLSMRTPASR
ncbi:MAG: hypothetical protein ACRD0A_01000 [Acidimicrobiales bacterium]